MKLTRRTLIAAVAGATMLSQPLMAVAQDLPRNLRMVIGSTSTGGDTYQAASIVAEALAEQLDINIKVDAVGGAEGFKALSRDKRGATVMLYHDHAYLSDLYDVAGSPDIFAEFLVGPSVTTNPGNAYLVAKNSPYQTMEDILTAAADGERVRVAIQPGGVSEIGFTAMRNAARVRAPGSEENIVPVNTGSQADKNQAMFDGLADVINGSIQANEQFAALPEDDQKAMRFVWITATPETLEGSPEAGMGNLTRADMMQYAAPETSVTLDGTEDFTFDKEFFLIYNKDTDPAQMQAIDDALAAVFEKGDIQTRMLESFFIPNYRPTADSAAHLEEKRDTYRGVIDSLKAE
ncbi:ABC transporter substrate-binding protein [Paracoccus tegillarcae]|uniref:ABC transporter substrate-binding protein n=1 Tax=Paracoccus tegillarcae TaxID=1529068 RepID=A0A2K9EIY4_9RHOB|nr:ABC transporter substrate-binding protein [Paracoccus tegillarcae]AUH33327.1 ABC transporter substrate-binding protein [Paracoccus tegillarcae]